MQYIAATNLCWFMLFFSIYSTELSRRRRWSWYPYDDDDLPSALQPKMNEEVCQIRPSHNCVYCAVLCDAICATPCAVHCPIWCSMVRHLLHSTSATCHAVLGCTRLYQIVLGSIL